MLTRHARQRCKERYGFYPSKEMVNQLLMDFNDGIYIEDKSSHASKNGSMCVYLKCNGRLVLVALKKNKIITFLPFYHPSPQTLLGRITMLAYKYEIKQQQLRNN